MKKKKMFSVVFGLFVLVGLSHSGCHDGSNPCELDNEEILHRYFVPENGYHCLESLAGHVVCTCPNNSSRRDRPCRLCDTESNPCGSSSSLLTCTEINRSYLCLCRDERGEILVSNQSCDAISPPPPLSLLCWNGGVEDEERKTCHCPSGFIGDRCEVRSDVDVCSGVQCLSRGVCAISRLGSTVRSRCLCRSGSQGEFCEDKGVLGNCTSGIGCRNGGSCYEQLLGGKRWKFCSCRGGWTGSVCDKEYFRCQSLGLFVDVWLKKQGRYFQCRGNGRQKFVFEEKWCPRGLEFHLEEQACRRQSKIKENHFQLN